MGMFSGLLSTLGNAAPYAANALAARAQGQRVAQDKERQDALQAYMMQRQQKQDALAAQLGQAKMGDYASLASHRTAQDNAPKPLGLGMPGYDEAFDRQQKTIAANRPAPAAADLTLYENKKKIDQKYPAPVTPTNVYMGGVDPDTGKPTVYAGTSKGPPKLTNMEVQKPTTAAGGGGQSLSPEDRAKMYAQAKLDNGVMKAYEAKVMASGKVPGVAGGLAGAAAGNTGAGAMSQVAGILGNKATGMIDPDYQRYITAQRSYGRIMGNLQSKRYTDHQAEIERSISGLQGNDLNETIRYKQTLRDASLADPQDKSAPSGSGGAFDPEAFYQSHVTKAKKP